MKRNRMLSGLLAVVMVLSLTVMPALAATYTDVPADHWAVAYINDMTAKGIFQGVEAGKFQPNQSITTDQVLAVCARISVGQELRMRIGRDRAADIKSILGTTWVSLGKWEGEQYWFGDEYATCLETGIISKAELKELYQSGALSKPISREDFAFYLVRALQLGPKAERLSTYSLNFTDKASITPGRESYIYILNMYNIVTGNEQNAFQPQKTATRAEACAMFSRALNFMETYGTSVEIPDYASYSDWVSGAIAAAKLTDKGAILLSLNNPVSGPVTLSIPSDTPIYEDSMLASLDQLKEGSYARVNLNEKGAPIAVRLSGALETVNGSVVGISEESFLISVNGISRTLDYDCFIDVKVGGQLGGRDLIDLKGGYTAATCSIDRQGKLVAVNLTGGTRNEQGVITGVETVAAGGFNLTINSFGGESRRYTVPAEASVTINNLVAAELSNAYRGCYVNLRIYNEDGKIATAAVDSVTKYFQGAVKGTGASEGRNTITVADLTTGRAPIYSVTDATTYQYNGSASSFGAIAKDMYVTVRLSGDIITDLWAYPASGEVVGTVSSITYPKGTTNMEIEILKADDSTVTYTLDLLSPPQIMRNGRGSTLDKLVTGDAVTVTIRYNKITLIQAIPQTANVTGTISKISQDANGITLEIKMDDGSGTANYFITAGVTVTQDGNTLSMYDLRVDYHVAMVTSGDKVTSLVVDKVTNDANKLTGTVILNNYKEKTITLRVDQSNGNEIIYTVSTANINSSLDAATGTPISVEKFTTGDVLDIYGTPGEGRTFNAKTIIRR